MSNAHEHFWDKEYAQPIHLALSTKPAEDLLKFLRYLERQYNGPFLSKGDSVLDLGCGNGRNLIHLGKAYGIQGIGYDMSREAIDQAIEASKNLLLSYEVRSIAWPLPLPDNSQTLVLDMMTSHFLRSEERDALRHDIHRVLAHRGWFFFKTHVQDEDAHSSRLLRDYPADEPGSYIHPEFGVLEHVYTEKEIEEVFSPLFTIHKTMKSHGHLRDRAKRRTISVYMEKK
jgi:SAM-dependent methyltransferase